MDLNYLKEKLSEKLISISYKFVDLKLSYKDGDRILSLTVDRIEPISLNDIVYVTDIISPYLDELMPNEEGYMLEISSLGAEKPLSIEELDNYISKYVEVRLINPILGENIYQGDLVKVEENTITISYRIKTRLKEVIINKDNISKIRLAIKF